MKFLVGALLWSLVAVVNAANQVVQVGPSGSFVFTPNSVTAAVGDTIEFQFESNVITARYTFLTFRIIQ